MKKILLLLIGGLLLACTFSTLPMTPPAPTPAASPQANPTASVPAPSPSSQVNPATLEVEANFTLVRLSRRDGNLTDQLHAEAPKAAALGQRMFVEFDAGWCPSCRVIAVGLEEKKAPELLAAFDGVYLIRLDVDEWGWSVSEAGFDFEAIPVFFRLDENGDPTGDWIDGAAWGPDTYENIANTLGAWFHRP